MTTGILLISVYSQPTAAARKNVSGKGTTVDGIWANYKIIDVHGHIGTFHGYDLSLKTLLSNVKRYGIKLVLISNIDGARLPGITANLDETTANKETLSVVQLQPQLKALAWTRPLDGAPDKIAPFLNLKDKNDRPIFVGIKFHPDMNQFAADDGRLDGYMNLCQSHGIPAVFHCGSTGSNSAPEKIYNLAKRHARVPVILYHMGFGTSHKAAIAVAAQALHNKDAQIFLETSQAEPQAVLEAIKAVGAERVLFGSDATYYGKQHYEHYEMLVKTLHDRLSPGDFASVMHGNAERLFKLN